MAATRADISRWFDEGLAQGATNMIVVCDTYDWEDYPVYVNNSQEARDYQPGSMQKVMEVYNLAMNKDEQLAARRVWNY